MRLGFTSILALHWAVVFTILAYGTVADAGVGSGLLSVIGIQAFAGPPDASMILIWVMMAGSFVFAALLFFWACMTGLFPKLGQEGDHTDLSRMAYGAAVSSMTIVLVTGLLGRSEHLYPAIAVQLAALATSYLASYAERLNAALTTAPEADDVRAAARLMALGAAHGAMLSRIAGRNVSPRGGAN